MLIYDYNPFNGEEPHAVKVPNLVAQNTDCQKLAKSLRKCSNVLILSESPLKEMQAV